MATTPLNPTEPAPEIPNPLELSRVLTDVTRQSSQLLTQFMSHQPGGGTAGMADLQSIAKPFQELFSRMMADPFRLAQVQADWWKDHSQLWHASMTRMMGQGSKPTVEATKGDKRFKHDEWNDNFLFDYIKQSYLLTAKHLHGAVAGVKGLDPATEKKVDFYTRQYINAIAPTNFASTNPRVLEETMRTGGANLVNGLKNLLADLERGGGRQLRIKMTDTDAFKLGENIASTKGKVVFQTELMQLLQYEPTTKNVYKRPLLIVPPWINKFYILDLRQDNSFIKWAVDQGHTVFVISWVNPDARFANKDFEDYMTEGPLAALDAIHKATGEAKVNAIGYCLGGTLLASTLGYLAAKGKKPIASATFFTTMIDFSEPGELEVFLDDATITSLEKRMQKQGYLDAHEMGETFSMLRANDLIWSFVINNYLLGKEPLPFDLLYWNSDSTRMPAKMHSYYLRNMYQKNLLKVPGGIALKGAPIDLTKIDVPAYFLSTVEDHIAPWQSTYAGVHLLRGPVRFVLSGAGHTAGVVNPPSAKKYGHWIGSSLPDDPEEWLAGTTQMQESWWNDWQRWINAHGGKKVQSRKPGDGKLHPLEEAPGSFVKARIETGTK